MSLKYAVFRNGVCEISTVDNSDNVGAYPSIEINSNGDIHINYYNASRGALMYDHGRGEQWDSYVVDDLSNVGQFNSIALDSNGIPHIRYNNRNNDDLKLATAILVLP